MLPSLRCLPRTRVASTGQQEASSTPPQGGRMAWVQRRPGEKVRLNSAARQLLGRSCPHHKLLRRTVRSLLDQVANGGGRAHCQLTLADGRSFELQAQPIAPGAEGLVGAACRMRALNASRPAVARGRKRAVDHLPYPVWLTDGLGRVTYRNPAARHMLRRPGAAAAGLHPGGAASHEADSTSELWPLHVAHPDDRESVADQWQEARSLGVPLEVGCRLHLPSSNGFRWHVVRAQPRRNNAARIVGWVATVQDEHDAHEMREDLRMAACLRNNFLRVASHELSTPLTSLQLALQLASVRIKRLVPNEQLRAPVADPLRRALDDTRRLVDIVSDLLDIKRLQVGKFFLRRSRANLGAVLQDMLARLDKPLHDAGCTLDFHQDRPIEGEWDVVRLQQVFFHLLSNVIKYAPGTCLHVRCGMADGAAWVAFEDEGPGIPTGARKKIFSLFERATEVRGTSGLGIGLYLCRRIVHAHNGNLRLISRAGKGAKFVLSLPQAASTPAVADKWPPPDCTQAQGPKEAASRPTDRSRPL